MRKKLHWAWEQIDFFGDNDLSGVMTCRAKVIGGWVLRTVSWNRKDKSQSESMVFVPDHDHEWHILPQVVAEVPECSY